MDNKEREEIIRMAIKLGIRIDPGEEGMESLMEACSGEEPATKPKLKDDQDTRIMMHNIGAMGATAFLTKGYYQEATKGLADIMVLVDHGFNKYTPKAENHLARTAMGKGSTSVWATGARGGAGRNIGGCAIIVGPSLAPRVTRKQVDPVIGRFCSVDIRGKKGKKLCIIASYNAPNGSASLTKAEEDNGLQEPRDRTLGSTAEVDQ